MTSIRNSEGGTQRPLHDMNNCIENQCLCQIYHTNLRGPLFRLLCPLPFFLPTGTRPCDGDILRVELSRNLVRTWRSGNPSTSWQWMLPPVVPFSLQAGSRCWCYGNYINTPDACLFPSCFCLFCVFFHHCLVLHVHLWAAINHLIGPSQLFLSTFHLV